MFKRFTKEYKYFKKKKKSVQVMIWDNEFKRYKTLEVREEIRADYDAKKSQIKMLEDRITKENKRTKKKEKGCLTVDEIARIEDDKTRANADLDRLKAHMKEIDQGIYGCKPCEEHPDGFNGVEQLIESLHEIIGMLNDYVKNVVLKK